MVEEREVDGTTNQGHEGHLCGDETGLCLDGCGDVSNVPQ